MQEEYGEGIHHLHKQLTQLNNDFTALKDQVNDVEKKFTISQLEKYNPTQQSPAKSKEINKEYVPEWNTDPTQASPGGRNIERGADWGDDFNPTEKSPSGGIGTSNEVNSSWEDELESFKNSGVPNPNPQRIINSGDNNGFESGWNSNGHDTLKGSRTRTRLSGSRPRNSNNRSRRPHGSQKRYWLGELASINHGEHEHRLYGFTHKPKAGYPGGFNPDNPGGYSTGGGERTNPPEYNVPKGTYPYGNKPYAKPKNKINSNNEITSKENTEQLKPKSTESSLEFKPDLDFNPDNNKLFEETKNIIVPTRETSEEESNTHVWSKDEFNMFQLLFINMTSSLRLQVRRTGKLQKRVMNYRKEIRKFSQVRFLVQAL